MFNSTNNTLRNVVDNQTREDKQKSIDLARKELELDIYNEHTINAGLTINLPRINIVLVIDEIINKHDYVLIEINRMSIKELQETIENNPSYIVERIHESYVIDAAIHDALIATTKSTIFHNIEKYIFTSEDKIAKALYVQYYSQVYEPIIQALNEISYAYLQFILLMKSAH